MPQIYDAYRAMAVSTPCLEGGTVSFVLRQVQREIESQWQTARLETKRYDEVLEALRR